MMRLSKSTTLLLFVTLLFLAGCKKDSTLVSPELEGKWKLTEMKEEGGLIVGQPAQFEAVTSSKTLEFNNDGSISSNGQICDFSANSNNPSNGLVSPQATTIMSGNCPSSEIYFEIVGQDLILSYPCFETCQAKFVKQ